jgi:hypothetical protein
MPQKRSLSVLLNRVRIRKAFAEARASLKELNRVLHHYAKPGHAMRKEAEELFRRFAALEKQLEEKIKNKSAYV